MSDLEADGGVQGERGAPVVNTARSMQSRISSFLAAGLMIALGVAALSWYYANALSRQKRIHQAATTAAVNSAQGDMTLPPLGRVATPPAEVPGPANIPAPAGLGVGSSGPAVSGPPASASGLPTDLPVEQARLNWNPSGATLAPYARSQPYGAPQRQVASDRRLSGAAFSRESTQSTPTAPTTSMGLVGTYGGDGALAMDPGRAAPAGSNRAEEGLTALLRPSITSPVRAQMLPTQQLLLPKGAFIDCTLETAIDSTLPGMTTCVTATDTFGVDGKVVLLERGSKLVGETRGEVQNGAARVFVLWTQARTPTGVLVPLDSPGTDELGRSGLPGEVNRHFWDRFGAAMLVSVIDGAMQAAVQSSARGNGAIIYNPSTSQDALTEVLKGTVNIAPTVIKHQGDRIQILVARDLDFRPVYELRNVGF
jgi:type IV secretion system protein VirB10